MTEQEWLSCTELQPMLEFLENKASERKRRLFAVACCRLFWSFLTDIRSREAVQAAEEYVDGKISRRLLRRAGGRAGNVLATRSSMAAVSATYLPVPNLFFYAPDVSEACAIALLRELFGPLPCRPVVIDPCWHTSTVRELAAAVYEERAFERMPILGDALEEAGCPDASILSHCRGPGPHARGCWVIDCLLGKTG